MIQQLKTFLRQLTRIYRNWLPTDTAEGYDLDEGYSFGADLHQSKLGNIKRRKGGAEIHCQDICLIKMMYLTRKIVLTQLINLIERRKRVWACISTRSLSSARVSLNGRIVVINPPTSTSSLTTLKSDPFSLLTLTPSLLSHSYNVYQQQLAWNWEAVVWCEKWTVH